MKFKSSAPPTIRSKSTHGRCRLARREASSPVRIKFRGSRETRSPEETRLANVESSNFPLGPTFRLHPRGNSIPIVRNRVAVAGSRRFSRMNLLSTFVAFRDPLSQSRFAFVIHVSVKGNGKRDGTRQRQRKGEEIYCTLENNAFNAPLSLGSFALGSLGLSSLCNAIRRRKRVIRVIGPPQVDGLRRNPLD